MEGVITRQYQKKVHVSAITSTLLGENSMLFRTNIAIYQKTAKYHEKYSAMEEPINYFKCDLSTLRTKQKEVDTHACHYV